MKAINYPICAFLCSTFALEVATAAPRGRRTTPVPQMAPPEMHRDSSRFFTTEQKNDFVNLTASKLSMGSREFDPFALPQDPDWQPQPREEEVIAAVEAAPEKVPFEQIINRIRITTIMPAEKRFMINGRAFDEGSELKLNFDGEIIRAKILSIGARAIIMRNVESNETASLTTNLLPSGMRIGKPGFNPDALFENPKDAPIILDESKGIEE